MRIVVPLLFLATSGCHMGFVGLACGLAGADGPYEQGAIAKEIGPDYVRTLACLDIGLAIHERDDDTLLDLDVGNRCIHGEPFAIEAMKIDGRSAAGQPHFVSLYDPRHELVPVHVGAQERGHERIRIQGLAFVSEVCFDLTGVVPDAPHTHSAPLCLVRADDGWRARSFS